MQKKTVENLTRHRTEDTASPIDQGHWDTLSKMTPSDVTSRSLCIWDERKGYRVPFLNDIYWVEPRRHSIHPDREGTSIEAQLPLVLIVYLTNAKDLSLSGRTVTEKELAGGIFFFRHLHRLPTDTIEKAFGEKPEEFLRAGLALGGIPTEISKASFELRALPRVPVGFHLWPKDDEFPARCVVTFDATIDKHLPLDVIWALVNILTERLIAMAPGA